MNIEYTLLFTNDGPSFRATAAWRSNGDRWWRRRQWRIFFLIVLLQQKFKQTQKIRERREEMKLLKLYSEPETMIPTKYYERSQ
ncbi:hypothetical protein Hanom_Chr04g00379241 [Helianthus anomalus]